MKNYNMRNYPYDYNNYNYYNPMNNYMMPPYFNDFRNASKWREMCMPFIR